VKGGRSRTVNEQGAKYLESREARVGTSVGVVDGAKRTEKGRLGTIVGTYGHPDYVAVDVLFDDGSVELYWHHELRTIKEQTLS
jgi:hypothetical protein